MTAFAESTARELANQCSFVSDVFHKLSQPLTALHCSLELSLARDESAEEFRGSVEAALQNAERLRQGLLLLRELSDADDPGNVSMPVALHKLLLDLREDLLPVFESAGVDFDVSCDPVQVRGNEAKLTRAFFYLLEYLQRSSQCGVKVAVRQKAKNCVEVRMVLCGTVSSSSSSDDFSDPMSAGEADIARRAFRAVGGDLELAETGSGQCAWIARLLLAA